MAHLRLLLSHSRCHPHPRRLLPLLRFYSSDISNPSRPTIKPVSYAPKLPQAPPDNSPAPVADVSTSIPNSRQDPLPRRWQQQRPPMPPQFMRQEPRFVRNAGPAIAPVSYPTRVAPLLENCQADEGTRKTAADDLLSSEGVQIQMEAAPIFVLPAEEETMPYTLLPVVKQPQKVAIDLVDALSEIKEDDVSSAVSREGKRSASSTSEVSEPSQIQSLVAEVEELKTQVAGPAIEPVSYPTRVAPLPEDRQADEGTRETAADDGLRAEGVRTDMEAAPIFVLPAEEETVPLHEIKEDDVSSAVSCKDKSSAASTSEVSEPSQIQSLVAEVEDLKTQVSSLRTELHECKNEFSRRLDQLLNKL